jgi:hypothetical protein
VKNIVIKYAFLQGMLIPYSSQNGFIYLISMFGPQGNAPIHIARNLQLWFLRQLFILQPWLDQSLDMGSIEHLWAILKKKLNQYKTPPKRLIGLWFCL